MNEREPPAPRAEELRRVVGVPGAVLMGLGSILGTGIFVSIGIAAGITGPKVVLATALGALVATFNGLSSAQLAAAWPKSGGTYEYGHRYLNPTLGFTAGWMFLCAKSASAATAALGFAGYALALFDRTSTLERVAVGIALVAALTGVVAAGMSRSNRANAVIVTSTLTGLVVFVAAGVPRLFSAGLAPFVPFLETDDGGLRDLLHATALMFVAYTGYGRIATLGEEIQSPSKNIPRAIVTTLLATMGLYVSVVVVAIAIAGASGLAAATRAAAAPLQVVAERLDVPLVAFVVSLAALTAMAGVLLNLLLGLSRVLLAMARRRDVPHGLAKLDEKSSSPRRAVLVTGALIAALVSIGSVKTTWSFSAFTVLVYYALTNAAALRLPKEQRRYPRVVPALGLTSCLGLAFFVDVQIWLAGTGLLAAGLVWHRVAARLRARDEAGREAR